MSVLHAIWLTWRLIVAVAWMAFGTYVLWLFWTDSSRLRRAWLVLRGKAATIEGAPEDIEAFAEALAALPTSTDGREHS